MNNKEIAEVIWILINMQYHEIDKLDISDDEKTNQAFRNMIVKWVYDAFKLEQFYRKQKGYEWVRTLFPSNIYVKEGDDIISQKTKNASNKT